MAVAVVLMAMAPAAIAWTSSTGIQMSSGLTGWGGFPLGGSGEGGGAAFDPVAAARALLLGMWDDINFINMLKAYAITNPNAYSSTNPQMNMQTLLNFVNTVASGAVGIAQNQMSDDDIAKEGENFDNTIFSNELDNAYKAAVASTQYEMAHQASLEKWLTDVKNGGTEVYNKEFGLIYDKKSGRDLFMQFNPI